MQINIDLTKLTKQELNNLLENRKRLGQLERLPEVMAEMARRGIAKHPQYQTLRWNQDSVRNAMQAFKDVAKAVKGNSRTEYTEAGGFKIGRSKDNPERVWIDTYCAIKTPLVNAVFVCYIKRPGDEPEFQLQIDKKLAESYSADQLAEALRAWRAIAARGGRD